MSALKDSQTLVNLSKVYKIETRSDLISQLILNL